jgi:hypothetical protein
MKNEQSAGEPSCLSCRSLSRLLSISNTFSVLSSPTLQAQKALKIKTREQYSSVVDCHTFDANPDSNFHVDADPDPEWHKKAPHADPSPSFTHVGNSGFFLLFYNVLSLSNVPYLCFQYFIQHIEISGKKVYHHLFHLLGIDKVPIRIGRIRIGMLWMLIPTVSNLDPQHCITEHEISVNPSKRKKKDKTEIKRETKKNLS